MGIKVNHTTYVWSLLFVLLFIGDFQIFQFQPIWFFVCLAFIYSGLNKKFNMRTLIMVFLLSSTLTIYYLINGHLFSNFYIKSSYLMLILVIFNSMIMLDYSRKHKQLLFLMVSLLMFFITGVYLSGSRGFIFGPNILYRVLLFIYVFSSLLILRREKNIQFMILTLFVILALTVNGSRGGVAVFSVVFILILYKFGSRKTFLVGSLVSGLLFITYLLAVDLPRAFIFTDYSGSNSILDRLTILKSSVSTIFNYPFGMGEVGFKNKFTFIHYPHNQILEFLLYYGILGLVLSCLVIIALLKVRNTDFGIINLTLFLPTLFSGTLTDNFMIYSWILSFLFVNVNKLKQNEK